MLLITVFWKENEEKLAKKRASAGGWATHGNNFNCLGEDLLPEFDRARLLRADRDQLTAGRPTPGYAADGDEMGRTPKIGDRRSGGERAGTGPLDGRLTDGPGGGRSRRAGLRFERPLGECSRSQAGDAGDAVEDGLSRDGGSRSGGDRDQGRPHRPLLVEGFDHGALRIH